MSVKSILKCLYVSRSSELNEYCKIMLIQLQYACFYAETTLHWNGISLLFKTNHTIAVVGQEYGGNSVLM